MKVTFLHHSCYVVEDDFTQIVFDYVSGTIPAKEDKGRIFVVTHAHADHFSRRIFQLQGDMYLLHEGIHSPPDLPVLHLAPYEEITLQDLRIKTSGSTDEGLSIMLSLEGKNLLHAGDLNIWHWPEDDQTQRSQMESDFYKYVKVFENERIHALFFNVDYRLKEDYIHGPKAALERLRPIHFFPMHFTEHPEILPFFKEAMQNHPTHIHLLDRNESIQI